jgi:competence protein ComEC
VTLTLSPAAANDPGWQLSFAAVAAILALEPRLASALEARRFAPPFAHAVAMTLAATLGTAPLLSLHFGRLSLVSLPVNVVAAPVVAAAMWIGMGAAAIGQLDGAAGALVALPAAPLLAFLEWLARTAARLPKANLGLHLGPVQTIGVYAGVLAVTALPRLRRPALGAAVVGVVAALAWPPTGAPALPPGDTRVSFLAVGQGDATLIQAGEHAVLVDAGPLDGPVLARLANAGVRRLDLAVVTHAQADHEGGMAAVLGRYPVDLLIDGGDGARTLEHRSVLRVAAAHGVRRLVPDAGQAVRAGPLELDVLWPRAEPAALHPGADPNQRAIVARLRSGSFDLLLTADAESDVTAPLAVGPVEALKVAHHGSADPGLPDLLRRLRPAVAVIEVGRHNPYGHPAPPTVAELAAAVPRVYRTDRDGTVTLDIRGGRMTVRTEDGWG